MGFSSKLVPGTPFPTLTANTLEGSIELNKAHGGADWQLLIVYRGQHCPLCTRYLNQLETFQAALNDIGVSITAVSADSKAQLESHLEQLNVTFPIAYGLTLEQMETLGLYVSIPRSAQETDHNFAEPGLFIINEQGQVQAVDISNVPFLRPEPEVIVRGITFVRGQDGYPIRGTFQGE
ncbi:MULTISPECIES: redoxin domain-containing protein [unclassified Vibrio]|uniref:Redoxin domain-containing protein n=1 Tax=Vibrio sp. HB236076 TaxID=3232307 RepID=A0AB39HK82_9VIBR|nr:redoxin domain-containing protein [Vibrio sp. HB161653]MDP5252791.1 redoxin family protein [Vibrio sp. HB161653]